MAMNNPDYNKLVIDLLDVLNNIAEDQEELEQEVEFDARLYNALDDVYMQILHSLELNGIVVE